MFFRNDDKKDPRSKSGVRTVPLLPLRDIIVFPHMVVPLFVGREKSIAALEEAMSHDKDILLAAQKKAKTNEPTADDIFPVGTLGTILQLLRLPDGTVKVLVEGKKRAHIRRYVSQEKFFLVEAEEVEELNERSVEVEALVRSVHATFEAYVKLNKRIPPEMLMSVATIDDPARLADTIVAHLSLKLNDKQAILEEHSPAKRLEKLYELMQGEIEILQVEKKIRTRVKKQMEKTQKEYYLNEQMQAIQKELGERDEFKSELQELEEKIKNKKMSKEAIAKAMNRKFVRISLGGVRDEAEIRGHRRTYIGALPGKIIQSLKKAGSGNPVFLLDEVDKMSTDFRGDPSSALLEVLDPEQNHTFNDHYLDLDYDLSKVLFICTANTLHGIPAPLQDRLEIIRIAGYTDLEKFSIARKYLVAKQREQNGLEKIDVKFSRKALMELIHRYTKESGVRGLEREVATLCRKIAKEVLASGNKDEKILVTAKRVHKLLGPPRFRYGKTEERDEIGLVTGLAWTEVGGELLQTEATVVPGKGKLILTGKLGDVMQESAQAAMSYVRSRAERFGLDKKFAENVDLHIHVAEGAVPKDGPSAGVTMATAMVSALTRIPVRKEVAMTGEITLRGRVLPIGGLKEKALAAHRGGTKTILIPKDNAKDIREIPMKVRRELTIHTVEHIDEVLRLALVLENPDAFFKPTDTKLEAPGNTPQTAV